MSNQKFYRIFGEYPDDIIEPEDDDMMNDIMFAERAEEDKWRVYEQGAI